MSVRPSMESSLYWSLLSCRLCHCGPANNGTAVRSKTLTGRPRVCNMGAASEVDVEMATNDSLIVQCNEAASKQQSSHMQGVQATGMPDVAWHRSTDVLTWTARKAQQKVGVPCLYSEGVAYQSRGSHSAPTGTGKVVPATLEGLNKPRLYNPFGVQIGLWPGSGCTSPALQQSPSDS